MFNAKSFFSIPAHESIPLWNQLAATTPIDLTIAHNPSLYSFYNSFLKHKTYYLILYHADQPTGLLPCTFHRKTMYSMPHFSYGGIHWLTETHPPADVIYTALYSWLHTNSPPSGFYRISIDNLETSSASKKKWRIRSIHPMFPGTTSNKATYWMELKQPREELWNGFSSNLRRKIRASERKGIQVKSGGRELIPALMQVYQANMHRLGSPAQGTAFFGSLLQSCTNEEALIAIAYLNQKPIGGGLLLSYQGFCENSLFATLQNFNSLYTSYALHWYMIQWAQSKEYHTYSFGRSTTGSSVEKYKTQWPVVIHPIYYSNPQIAVNSFTNHWLRKTWKLLPAFLVNGIGPIIAKRIY